MNVKRTRIELSPVVKAKVPLFYNYIDAVKRTECSAADYELVYSPLYASFAVIEAPSKLISGIIDYSMLTK